MMASLVYEREISVPDHDLDLERDFGLELELNLHLDLWLHLELDLSLKLFCLQQHFRCYVVKIYLCEALKSVVYRSKRKFFSDLKQQEFMVGKNCT